MKEILVTAFANEKEKISEDDKCNNGDDQHIVAKKFDVAETVIHFFLDNFRGQLPTTERQDESYFQLSLTI